MSGKKTVIYREDRGDDATKVGMIEEWLREHNIIL